MSKQKLQHRYIGIKIKNINFVTKTLYCVREIF